MAATERVVVLMSPGEKQALERKAAAAGRLSTGEFIRRAAAAYDAETARDEAELATLLPLLRSTHAETLRRLDEAERRVDETLAFLDAARRP
jgi:hypothetical protein